MLKILYCYILKLKNKISVLHYRIFRSEQYNSVITDLNNRWDIIVSNQEHIDQYVYNK